MTMPLGRAQAKLAEIERELKKQPDFQLYLISGHGPDGIRMERALLQIPLFKLWLTLSKSIALSSRVPAG